MLKYAKRMVAKFDCSFDKNHLCSLCMTLKGLDWWKIYFLFQKRRRWENTKESGTTRLGKGGGSETHRASTIWGKEGSARVPSSIHPTQKGWMVRVEARERRPGSLRWSRGRTSRARFSPQQLVPALPTVYARVGWIWRVPAGGQLSPTNNSWWSSFSTQPHRLSGLRTWHFPCGTDKPWVCQFPEGKHWRLNLAVRV